MLKKLFSAFMVFILFMSGTSIGFAEEDTTPLKLKSASINLKEAKVGDRIVITFEVEPDHESGPCTSNDCGDIELLDPSGKRLLSMFGYIGNNKYQYSMNLDSSDLKGVYSVDSITLSDEAGNRSSYYGSDPLLKDIKFNLLNGKDGVDNQPPTLSNLSIKKEVNAKEGIKLNLGLSDKTGPVTGGIIFTHSISGAVINESIPYNSITGKYDGVIKLPDNVKNGEYQLSFLLLRDQLGNEAWYRPEDYSFLRGVKINVTGGESDIEPPVFESVKLSQLSAFPGDQLSVIVKAFDKQHSIDDASITFKNTQTGQYFSGDLTFDRNINAYRTTISIPVNQMSGDYKIEYLILTDTVNNTVFISPGEYKLPTLTINPFFSGVVSKTIVRGSSFDPLEQVKAYSPTEGDLTQSLKIEGSVDSQANGIYLLKYSVPSKQSNYTYKNYRWITVNDQQENSSDTQYFNTDVIVGVPDNNRVSLSKGSKVTSLSDDTKISTEGEYSISAQTSGAQTNGSSSSASGFSTMSNKMGLSSFSAMSITPTLASANMITNNKIKFIIDKTAPSVPIVNQVNTNSVTVTGKAEPNTIVNLYINNKQIKAVKADKKGMYTIPISKQKIGTDLKVNSKDAARNISKARIIKVSHAPTVSTVSNLSNSVSGKALPNAMIKIYVNGKYYKSGKADKLGNYKISITKQLAGKEIKVTETNPKDKVVSSVSTKVIDKIPPIKPVVNKITHISKYVTGTGEKGTKVCIYSGNKILGKTTVGKYGSFKAIIPLQKKGTRLSVYLLDASGNKSPVKVLFVQ
jgi:hypothetical protein